MGDDTPVASNYIPNWIVYMAYYLHFGKGINLVFYYWYLRRSKYAFAIYP